MPKRRTYWQWWKLFHEREEKTSRSQRRGKGKCLKGRGKRRTVLEMRKVVLHLKLEKIKDGPWPEIDTLRHGRKKILVQQSHLISVKWEREKENRGGRRENGTEEVRVGRREFGELFSGSIRKVKNEHKDYEGALSLLSVVSGRWSNLKSKRMGVREATSF